MAGTMTHAYFGLDVYDKLDTNTKNRLYNHKEHLKLFSQGHDILYFYKIGNKKFLKYRDLGKFAHKNNTRDFFINLITYIKNNKLENNNEIISYLYGNICHYILDYTIHPFIIYRSGILNKNDKKTYKYYGLHDDIETFIDSYISYQKNEYEIKDFKTHEFCFNYTKFSKELLNTIDHTYSKTFGIDNIGTIYMTSAKIMKKFYKLFRNDKTGIKRIFYKLVSNILPKGNIGYEAISYNIPHNKKLYYLNIEKEKWNHPCNENETYNYSFVELYIVAVHKAVSTINSINEILYNNDSLESLKEIFDNTSYATGKNCNENNEMKYFGF